MHSMGLAYRLFLLARESVDGTQRRSMWPAHYCTDRWQSWPQCSSNITPGASDHRTGQSKEKPGHHPPEQVSSFPTTCSPVVESVYPFQAPLHVSQSTSRSIGTRYAQRAARVALLAALTQGNQFNGESERDLAFPNGGSEICKQG